MLQDVGDVKPATPCDPKVWDTRGYPSAGAAGATYLAAELPDDLPRDAAERFEAIKAQAAA